MKKSILVVLAAVGLVGGAHAADLRGSMKDPESASKYNWTGFTAGMQAGYGWGKVDSKDREQGTGDSDWADEYNTRGGVLGLRGAYNYQRDMFVLGAVGDLNISNQDGSVDSVFAGTIKTSMPLEASLRARLGVAFDNVLVYGTGGVVWSRVKNHYSDGSNTDTFTNTEVAGIYGAGVEYGFDRWTLGLEYTRYKVDFTDVGPATDPGWDYVNKSTNNKVMLNLNRKF